MKRISGKSIFARRCASSVSAAIFASSLAGLGMSHLVDATVYTFTGPTGTGTTPVSGDWATAGNFIGGVPVGSTSTILDFNGSGSTPYISTANIGTGTFSLNSLVLNSTASVAETIAPNTSTNTLTFNGSSPTITDNGTGDFIINTGILAQSNLAINGTGTGNIYLGGTVLLTTVTSGITDNYTGGSVIATGVLNTGRNLPLSIAAGAVFQSTGTVNLSVLNDGSSSSTDITGAGTLALRSTTNNSTTSPDIYFGPDHSGTSYYGTYMGVTTLDLGTAQRFIFAKTGHNSIANYPTNNDAQINSNIQGSGGITYVAQNTSSSFYPQLALGGSNTFTGRVEIDQGSIYLRNQYALTKGNKLLFADNNTSTGSYARFFLYGNSVTVSNLESTGTVAPSIANGNVANYTPIAASTLTINQTANTTYNGTIVNSIAEYDKSTTNGASGVLSIALSPTSTGTLQLSGTSTYTGTTTINGGTLRLTGSMTSPTISVGGAGVPAYFQVDSASSAASAITLNKSGFLVGAGTVNGTVAINNGSGLIAGNGGVGVLTLTNIATFGTTTTDTSSITTFPGSNAPGINFSNGVVVNSGASTISINVVGSSLANGFYPLVAYNGSIGGTGAGIGAFALGTLPGRAVGNIDTSTAGIIGVDITGNDFLIWTGKTSSEWSTNTIAGAKNWKLNSSGLATDFLPTDTVVFDDTASTGNVSINNGNLTPSGVTFNNNTLAYTLSGTNGITGATGLTKNGNAPLTIGTSNSYTGPTNINGGLVSFTGLGSLGATAVTLANTSGVALNLSGIAGGNITLASLAGGGTAGGNVNIGNGTLTVGNGTSTVYSGVISGGVNASTGNLIKVGAGKLTLSISQTYTGTTTINGGTLSIPSLAALPSGIPTLGTTGILELAGGTNTFANTLAFPTSSGVQVDSGATTFSQTVALGNAASLNIGSGATVTINGALTLSMPTGPNSTNVAGTGTLILRDPSSTETPTGADISQPVASSNDGNVFGSGVTIDVGTGNKFIFGEPGRNDVSRYAGDLRFDGPITGSATLNFFANSNNSNHNVHIALNADNSGALTGGVGFTGAVTLNYVDLDLTNNNALTSANSVTFAGNTSNQTNVFLYGHNVSIGSLNQTSIATSIDTIRNGSLIAVNGGTGTLVSSGAKGVALGLNSDSTLTINQTTAGVFNGVIADGGNDNVNTSPVASTGSTGNNYHLLNIVKNGPATLTLGGSNLYTGSTVINSGTLLVTGSLNTGTVLVNAGTLSGTGIIGGTVTTANGSNIATTGTLTVGGLVFGTTATDLSTISLTRTGTSTDLINDTGSLAVNSGANTITINLSGLAPAAGEHPLIQYTGTSLASASSFVLGTLPAGVTANLVNNSGSDSIDLNVTAGGDPPKWTGAYNSEWINGPQPSPHNWQLTAAGTPTDYADGNQVTFDDSASNYNVDISSTNVLPGSVTFANNGATYNFTGTKGIAGNIPVLMTGSGTVVFNNPNTYTGDTLIKNGTFVANTSGGVTSGPLGTGTLRLGDSSGGNSANLYLGTAGSTGGVTLSNPIVAQTGTGGTLSLGGQNTAGVDVYSGNVSIGTTTAGQNLTLLAATGGEVDFNGNIAGTTNTNLTVGNGNNNNGLVKFNGTASVSGTLTVNNGMLQVINYAVQGTNNILQINSGATFVSTGTVALSGNTSSNITSVSGGGLLSFNSPNASLANPDLTAFLPSSAYYAVSVSTNLFFARGEHFIEGSSANNSYGEYAISDLTLTGQISGSGNVTVSGTPNSSDFEVGLENDNSDWTGNLTITRGDVAAIVTNALTANNNVTFNPVILTNASTGLQTVTDAALYLFGMNLTIGNLSGVGAGNMYIRNGSRSSGASFASAATLTVTQTVNGVFAGVISDGPDDYYAGHATDQSLGFTKNGAANLVLSGANTYSGDTNVNAGILAITSTGTFGASNIYVNTGGILAFQSSAGSGIVVRSLPGSLTINSGGKVAVQSAASSTDRQILVPANFTNNGLLNLGANDLDLPSSANYQNISAQIASGYNGGTWNGATGITSSAAARSSNHLTALGVILNDNGSGTPYYGNSGTIASTFSGTVPLDGDVLVKYTYYGDANLDGKVDGSDYSKIDNSFLTETTTGSQISGWFNGDFNYDGVVNGSDYTLIDNAFNTQGASLAATIASPNAIATDQIGGGTSAVPEPTTLGLLGIGAIGLLGRRRRQTN